MGANDETGRLVVLTVEAVRWGIGQLQARPVHPFFLAYLHLRKWAQQTGSVSGIQPRWSELTPHLQMAGGPPGRPYYRPLAEYKVRDPANYWMNKNVAGSFAPSSIRATARLVVETEDGGFRLRENHATLAREYLLLGEPLSATAFAAYWYRDYGFMPGLGFGIGPNDLAGAFAEDFGFDSTDPDFDTLFVVDLPEDPILGNWFESFAGGGGEA
jgi:hypothetical protein